VRFPVRFFQEWQHHADLWVFVKNRYDVGRGTMQLRIIGIRENNIARALSNS